MVAPAKGATGVLAALADDSSWLILCELARGTRRRSDLTRCVSASPATISEWLQRLVEDTGLAIQHELPEDPPARAYSLSVRGRKAWPMRQAAAVWQATSTLPAPPTPAGMGGAALRLLDRKWVLPIIRLVAVGEHRRARLLERLPGLKEATFDDQLKAMCDAGVMVSEHDPFSRRVDCYLTDVGRRLSAVVLLWSAWEWRWHQQPARPEVVSDLAGLVRIAAPLVRLPEGIEGVCELSVEHPSACEPHILVAARYGGLEVLERPGPTAEAHTQGKPLAWCAAMIGGSPASLRVGGSQALAATIVNGVHSALLGTRYLRRPPRSPGHGAP